MAGFGQPVDEGGGQVVVLEKRAPFAETQIGGDEGGLFLVPALHQFEEESDLDWFDGDVPDLIDQQRIPGEVFTHDLAFGVIGQGLKQLVDQFGEGDETATVAVIDGVDEEAGGQSGLATAGATQPEDVLMGGHEAQRIVYRQELFLVEFGLPSKRVGLDDQRFGNGRLAQTVLTGVFTLGLVFVFYDMAQEVIVGEVLLGGQPQILVPVGQESLQAQVLELGDQVVIHGGSLREEDRPGRGPRTRTGRALRSARLPGKLHVG